MRVAVISAVYNEEENIARLLEALLRQTRPPNEIIIVDDGSRDRTGEIVREWAAKDARIRYFYCENRGPAHARNLAWRQTEADICAFTDGDCVPDPDWLDRLALPFQRDYVGAVCGTYRTLNTGKILARFIGHEIAWRYRNIRGPVDAHGSYNLAVRREVLFQLGGYNEQYRVPSGEDWDLTYRISRQYKIIFDSGAVVGHSHPEKFWPYMKLQVRRGYDRIKLYNDHPDKRRGDVYTSPLVKYQVAAAGLSLPAIVIGHWWGPCGTLLAGGILVFLGATSFLSFGFIANRDPGAAGYGIVVQFVRYYAWCLGALLGVLRFGFRWSFHARES